MSRSVKKVAAWYCNCVSRGNEKAARKAQTRSARRRLNATDEPGLVPVRAICDPWDRPGDGKVVRFKANPKEYRK